MEALSIRLLPFFDWLLWTTIQAALLFCLIMLVQLILRGRLPIRWHYCLWLLLLIRLTIPFLPESKMSIFNLVPRSIQQGRILESFSEPQDARSLGFYSRIGMAEPQEEDAKESFVGLARMVPLLWLLGSAALAIYVGAGNFHLWWLVTRERPLTDQKILDLLEDCKAEMGVRNILGIVTTDKVRSAALFGFVRPRLLLPTGMVEALNIEELRYVFLHELGHLRRRDIYVAWLMSLLQVLHWFNPLVWLAFYRMQSDRELACDALVLTHTRRGESKDYGRTIVNLLERFSRPQRLPSMAGILETKSQLKRRIKMIAKFKKTSRTRWTGAMLLLAALACIVLTNAYVAKADFIFGTPTNLGPIVNTSHSDDLPSVSADGLELYFESNRPGGSGDWDVWVISRATPYDEWGEPTNLGPLVNSSGWDGSPCPSADGLALYFASDRSGGYGNGDIWVTRRATRSDDWGPPENLGPTVNSSADEVFPAISFDGLQLYFCEYFVFRPGGHGRSDLWVTTRPTTSEPWGPPVNLGPTVNSSDHDRAPSISTDGLALFFMSKRPGGYGGNDLWITRRVTGDDEWGTPVNLGPPVNSPSSDAGPGISADGHTLYFHSDRSGGEGYEDIWQVSILPVVDFNADGIVDGLDVCLMVDFWHTDESLYDIAPMPFGDGIVDVKDLVLISEHLTPKEVDPNDLTP